MIKYLLFALFNFITLVCIGQQSKNDTLSELNSLKQSRESIVKRANTLDSSIAQTQKLITVVNARFKVTESDLVYLDSVTFDKKYKKSKAEIQKQLLINKEDLQSIIDSDKSQKIMLREARELIAALDKRIAELDPQKKTTM